MPIRSGQLAKMKSTGIGWGDILLNLYMIPYNHSYADLTDLLMRSMQIPMGTDSTITPLRMKRVTMGQEAITATMAYHLRQIYRATPGTFDGVAPDMRWADVPLETLECPERYEAVR